MTERLYYDSAALQFDAQAIAHDGEPTRVILDRTAFYPTSGGQPHDTGTMGGARVIDVIDQDDHIVHVTDAPVPLGPVHGAVDGERRNDFTIQHTAQHLLSALAGDRFGWHTESVHFGATYSSIEFDTALVSDTQLTQLERWANDAVGDAIPVRVTYGDSQVATGLRKPPAISGTIRIVTIEGLDRSACGGTHVTSTARLGSLVCTGVERIRGRTRVAYLAGDRVHAEVRRQAALLDQLVGATGAGEAELVEVVKHRLASLRDHEKRLSALERELAKTRVRELLREAPTGPGGVRRLVLHPGAGAVDALRQQLQAATTETMAFCIATTTEPATIIVATSPDTGLHAGTLLKSALEAVGGRGGGSATFAQGTVPDPASLNAVVNALLLDG
jgi:alanyl-tRNA synthetase